MRTSVASQRENQAIANLAMFDIFSRRGCHLCEILIEEMLALTGDRTRLQVHDIDTKPEWRERYHTRVPVVEHDGQVVCEYRLDKEKVLDLLRQLPAPDA